MVALREIGAADLGRMKHHMARGVAWAVPHIQAAVPDSDLVAVLQPARGCESGRGRKAKHLVLLGQTFDPELIPGAQPDDGQLQPRRQLGGAASVEKRDNNV